MSPFFEKANHYDYSFCVVWKKENICLVSIFGKVSFYELFWNSTVRQAVFQYMFLKTFMAHLL